MRKQMRAAVNMLNEYQIPGHRNISFCHFMETPLTKYVGVGCDFSEMRLQALLKGRNLILPGSFHRAVMLGMRDAVKECS